MDSGWVIQGGLISRAGEPEDRTPPNPQSKGWLGWGPLGADSTGGGWAGELQEPFRRALIPLSEGSILMSSAPPEGPPHTIPPGGLASLSVWMWGTTCRPQQGRRLGPLSEPPAQTRGRGEVRRALGETSLTRAWPLVSTHTSWKILSSYRALSLQRRPCHTQHERLQH